VYRDLHYCRPIRQDGNSSRRDGQQGLLITYSQAFATCTLSSKSIRAFASSCPTKVKLRHCRQTGLVHGQPPIRARILWVAKYSLLQHYRGLALEEILDLLASPISVCRRPILSLHLLCTSSPIVSTDHSISSTDHSNASA
jgi:hypothetical protein